MTKTRENFVKLRDEIRDINYPNSEKTRDASSLKIHTSLIQDTECT